MSRSSASKSSNADRWLEIHDQVKVMLPHLAGWFDNPEDFVSLMVKAKEDGTCIAVAKGFDSGGGPIVCFGVGYGPIGAFLAIDGTINGNKWRVDEPWAGNSK